MIHRFDLTVEAASIDANGHANNVEYVRWMQQAAISHADVAGCTEATKAAGATWVVRSHHVEYLRSARECERLTVLTWVSTLRRSSSLRKYLIVRGDEILARGETFWVFVNVRTGRPLAIPAAVSSVFVLVPAEQEPQLQAK
ncbi:MAG: acyl-CoA thioesterase [Terrimicrobiaceae bacterium]